MDKFKKIALAIGSVILVILGLLIGRRTGGGDALSGAVDDLEKRDSELGDAIESSLGSAGRIADGCDDIELQIDCIEGRVDHIGDAVESAEQSIDIINGIISDVENGSVD